MSSRIARITILVGAALLLAALVAAGGGFSIYEGIPRYDGRASWLLGLSVGAVVLLGVGGWGLVSLFRRRKLAWGGLAACVWLIVAVNLLFWSLLAAQVTPLQRLYEKGHVVWIGEKALIFGHGYWEISDGYWEHQTIVTLAGGERYRGPTLDLLHQLRSRGAKSVWGSWCFTGNYPYIRKDLVSGRRVPWPSYASYNTTPGVTIPIWLGSTFLRLGWPEDRYDVEPPQVGPYTPDTLLLMNPSIHHVEQAFALVQQRVSRHLPRPDSVSWYPVEADTVYGQPWSVLRGLDPDERKQVREAERSALKSKAKTGLALFWVRGRAFPMYVRIPPRFRRASDPKDATYDMPLRYAETAALGRP